ncbi:MAG: hypothetical protein EBU72_13050, partial [Betaproteobacteria bacterium]|nr:hypothetical protein [Betaproteobacteria bacterium]
VDTTAPTTGIATVALSDDRGSSTSDFVTNIQKQTIRGTLGSVLATGESVQVSTDNGVNWTTATTNTGSADWSIADVQLSGSGTLQAKVVDLAGNSGPVKSQNYVVDLVKPAAPSVAEQGSNDLADGLINTAESATTTFRVTLTGTGSAAPVANDSVELLLDGKSFLDKGKVTLTATNIANRYVDFVVAKSDLGEDGAKTLSARVTDVAGNGNDATVMPVGFTLDTTAPTTQVLNLGLSMDTGKLSNDFNTNVAAQTVGGTLTAPLAAGESVMVSTDSGVSWRKASLATFNSTSVGMTPGGGSSASTAGGGATAGDTQLFGLWKLENVTLSGNGTIQAKVVDLAGNDGPVKTQAYTLDTVAPTTTVATVQFSQDTGVSGDLITNVPVQTISGTLSAALAAGESVMLSKDNGQSWVTASATVGSTAWSMADVTLSEKDTLKAKVVDTAGNDGIVAAKAYELDTQSPGITGVTVTATGAKNSTLNEGDVITATVTTNEAMVVTGTPQVDLQIGSSTVKATYDAGASTSKALAFKYTVQAGQTDSDGFSVPANAVKFNNGALTDTAGNTLNLASTALVDNASYKVDTTAPRLTGSSANGKSIFLYYSEALSADSLPGADKFAVKVAGNAVAVTAVAPYQGDSSILQLTVANDLVRTQAVTVSYTQPASATGAIQDLAGNKAANLIDQTVLFAPAVTSIEYSTNDGTLKLGDSVDLTVTFTQAVTVTGSPILQLNTGGQATYVSGDNPTTKMLFHYTVGKDDKDVTDLQTALTGLLLGDSTIKDSLGNDALYSSANSINPVGVLAVDKLSPTVTAVALTAATDAQNNTLNVGDTVTATVTTSEPVVVSGTGGTGLQLKLLVGSDLVFANYDSTVGNTMLFKYTILAGQTDADGISIPQNPLVLNDRTLADPAGNVMDTSAAQVLANASYKVDTTAPTTSIATVQLSSDSGASGDFITNVAAQTISGTLSANLAAGEAVLVSQNNGANWTAATATVGSTAWSITGVTLSGSGTLQAKVVDAAGNNGPLAQKAYTVDTVVPGTPTLAEQGSTDLTDSLMSNAEAATTGFRVGLVGTGTAAPVLGDTVELLLNGQSFSTAKKVVLESSHLTNQYVDFTVLKADLGTDGSKSLTAKVTDIAGNASAASAAKSFTLDTAAPTVSSVSYGSNDGLLAVGEAVQFTLALSEAATVSGGSASLSLSNGGTASYVSGSGTTSLVFGYTPAAGQQASADLGIAASNPLTGSIFDAAGNALDTGNLAGANPTGTLGVDVTAPIFSVAYVSGSTLGLVFSETLDSSNLPLANKFTVLANGTPVTVSGVAESGSNVVLTLASAVSSTATVLVSYTDPTGNDANAIQDLAGNDAASLSSQSVLQAPSLQTNALNGVSNFDVMSNIVLNYGQNITAVSGKYIYIEIAHPIQGIGLQRRGLQDALARQAGGIV